MLSFHDYHNVIIDLEDEIKLIDHKIMYAEIDLIGHISRNYNPSIIATKILYGAGDTDEEKKILNSNLDYQRLLFKRDELQFKLDFIREHADFPKEEMNSSNMYN